MRFAIPVCISYSYFPSRRRNEDADDEEDEDEEDEEEETNRERSSPVAAARRAPPPVQMAVTPRNLPVTRTSKKRPLECYVCAYKADTPLRACLDPTRFRYCLVLLLLSSPLPQDGYQQMDTQVLGSLYTYDSENPLKCLNPNGARYVIQFFIIRGRPIIT